VHEINFANNRIEAKGCQYLAEMLRENVSINKLVSTFTHSFPLCSSIFIAIFHKKIQVLSGNCLKSGGIAQLAQALLDFDRIRELDLSGQ
jgi:hypothetical protein